MKAAHLLFAIFVCIFLVATSNVGAQSDLGTSFSVTDDGAVDNMEAVYNGRNIALVYNWAPGTTEDPYFFKDPGALYFQLFDRDLQPAGKPRKLIERGTHQVKMIWDGEKYFVAATVWHKTNDFYHHKSLLFLILDENGDILKQKEVEQGRGERGFAYIPTLLLLTGEKNTHYLAYRNDIMEVGYKNGRYATGRDSFLIKINSKENKIYTKISEIKFDDGLSVKKFNNIKYDISLSENGFAVISNRSIPHKHTYRYFFRFAAYNLKGEHGEVTSVPLNNNSRWIEAFEYLNGNYYVQAGNDAHIMIPDKNGQITLEGADHGIINDSFTTFVSGNLIFSCYYSSDYSRRSVEIVVRRHGIKGRFIDRITTTALAFPTPFSQEEGDVWDGTRGLERYYYRSPTVVSVGTHSYFIYVEGRVKKKTEYYTTYADYKYSARKLDNEPSTKSRVVYVRAGTQDVLPNTRLVMWNVANVKNVKITMPDGTQRIYAPTGHMQVQHNGEEQKLILRANGTKGEKLKRIIRVKP